MTASAPVSAPPAPVSAPAPAEGDAAPDFTLPAAGGGQVSLADFKGRWVVLYFYPKDDTPGCTKEACAFRDAHADFTAAGAAIIGVSKDSPKSHDRFKDKYSLPFTLVSDTETTLAQSLGIWEEKSRCGRTYMGMDRATVLIAPDGTIRRLWRKVKVDGHAAQVLAAVKG